VLTDNGKEFKGAFAAGCEVRGIRVTRTKPRHAWTNGFVERFQKTILHEHWRIAFRRQYFTGRRALQTTLDRFLQFYNYRPPAPRLSAERPHAGDSVCRRGGRMNAWMKVSTPLRNWTT
jgi:transposase InsO family protein